MKVCIVVPTFNERENIGPLLARIRKVGMRDLEVLFVDDASPDGTSDEIRREMSHDNAVHLLVREGKKGIGSAYVEGFAESIRTINPDVILEMDADLQHPPEKIPELVSAVASGADIAIASRKVPGGGTTGWSYRRKTISSGANFYARVVLGIPVNDCTSGFRAFDTKAARALADNEALAAEFFFQVASLYLLKKRGMKMVEVPYVFGKRAAGKSKLSGSEVGKFFVGVMRLRFSSIG